MAHILGVLAFRKAVDGLTRRKPFSASKWRLRSLFLQKLWTTTIRPQLEKARKFLALLRVAFRVRKRELGVGLDGFELCPGPAILRQRRHTALLPDMMPMALLAAKSDLGHPCRCCERESVPCLSPHVLHGRAAPRSLPLTSSVSAPSRSSLRCRAARNYQNPVQEPRYPCVLQWEHLDWRYFSAEISHYGRRVCFVLVGEGICLLSHILCPQCRPPSRQHGRSVHAPPVGPISQTEAFIRLWRGACGLTEPGWGLSSARIGGEPSRASAGR